MIDSLILLWVPRRLRFLLDMPTEFVEVLPDAIGRALNDYPGLAGSHTLAFDGKGQDYRVAPAGTYGTNPHKTNSHYMLCCD